MYAMHQNALTGPAGSVLGGAPAHCKANCKGKFDHDIPTPESACAVRHEEKRVGWMEECCREHPVLEWADGCGLYCTAPPSQTVWDVQSCLMRKAIVAKDACTWLTCRQNNTATEAPAGTEESPGDGFEAAGLGAVLPLPPGNLRRSSTSAASVPAPRAGPGLRVGGALTSALVVSLLLSGVLQL